jgi:hypothetical protein
MDPELTRLVELVPKSFAFSVLIHQCQSVNQLLDRLEGTCTIRTPEHCRFEFSDGSSADWYKETGQIHTVWPQDFPLPEEL